MAWKDTLQPAAFRGVPFDAVSTSDGGQNSLVHHTIPYTNGADLEPTGFDAESIRVQAIFFGDDYEERMNVFLAAVRDPSVGALMHPVFGSAQVAVDTWEFSHTAEEPDSVTINVTFLRHGVSVALFTQQLIQQKAEAMMAAADTALTASAKQLAAQANKIGFLGNVLAGIQRAARFADRLRRVASAAKQFAQHVITAGLNVINAPYAWAADMAAIADGMIDLRPFDKDVIMGRWRELRSQFGRALRLPNDGAHVDRDTRRDDQSLVLFMGVQEMHALVSVAAEIFTAEADEPVLTPGELEEITNDVRTYVQALIEQHRAEADLLDVYAVIEALKITADQVQSTANALLALKPPLIVREVEYAMPLRLLAHHWYGDHHRAIELLRLNPAIRHPNFMQPGDRLNAYAR